MASDSTELRLTIEKMIQDAQLLLGLVIKKAGPADERARLAKSEWTERHPLLVLIQAARESLRLLLGSVREPWLLAQLSACLEVVRKWKEDPGWKEVESCLVKASDFSHVISMLILAERIKAWGHKVQLVSHGRHASPDLRVQAVGGKQEWLQIECYQPRPLSGKPLRLSLADAYKITKEAMKKARVQLGNETPGIITLCMYNQPRSNIDLLKKIVEARLRETSRSSLAGFILMCQNTLQTSQEGSLSFSPVITLDFLQNPAYFGVVGIGSDVPKDSPGSLIGPALNERLNEIIVNDFVLLQRAMQLTPEVQDSDLTLHNEAAVVSTKIEKIPILESLIRDRAIFSWSGDKYSVYFEGEGNIDFVCGKCGTTLARRIWKLSCNNIVVQCPTCGSYSEFPPQESSTYLKTSNVAI